jgi:hypothetical protein
MYKLIGGLFFNLFSKPSNYKPVLMLLSGWVKERPCGHFRRA